MKRIPHVLSVIYVLALTLLFTTQYGNFRTGFSYQIIFGLVLIIILLFILIVGRYNFRSESAKDIKFFLKAYLCPSILIHLYTIVLMLCGVIKWDYFSSNASDYVPIILSIVSLFVFGEKAFKYVCIATGLSWFLSIMASLLLVGPEIFPNAISQTFGFYQGKNYFELHDLVLSLGLLLSFYIGSRFKLTYKNLGFVLLVLIITFMGMKRISVLAILVVCVYAFVAKHRKSWLKYKLCVIASIAIAVGSYVFLYLCSSNILFDLLAQYNINPMGRNYYYQAIIALSEFKVDFLGIGRNVVAKLLETDYAYLRVGGVHSDIIKMYVENGFVLYAAWLVYYLFWLLKTYKKRFGVEAAYTYSLVTIYTFFMYFTDNVEIYFIYKMLFILLPAVFAMTHKEQDIADTVSRRTLRIKGVRF